MFNKLIFLVISVFLMSCTDKVVKQAVNKGKDKKQKIVEQKTDKKSDLPGKKPEFVQSQPEKKKQAFKDVIAKPYLVEASLPARPDWYFNNPQDDKSHSYLVGISNKISTEKGALDDAARNATNSFIKSCGIKVNLFDSYVKETKNQSTNNPIESTLTGFSSEQERANAFVSGLKIKTRYFEKYEKFL